MRSIVYTLRVEVDEEIDDTVANSKRIAKFIQDWKEGNDLLLSQSKKLKPVLLKSIRCTEEYHD